MLSVLINTHLLMPHATRMARYFYASSACVYNAAKQAVPGVPGLAEAEPIPPCRKTLRLGKLFSERMYRHFFEDFGIEIRVARYHNVYGPHGPTMAGAKAPPPSAGKSFGQS